MGDEWLSVWNTTYVKKCSKDKFRRLVGGLVPDALNILWWSTGPSVFPNGPLQEKRKMLWALYYLQKSPENEICADCFVDVGRETFLSCTEQIHQHWGIHLRIVRFFVAPFHAC